jgi:hypothetical protein
MHYNFNVYVGRKMFNVNFAAKNRKQAIRDASKLIPDFAKLHWILWYCPPKGRKWRLGVENHP